MHGHARDHACVMPYILKSHTQLVSSAGEAAEKLPKACLSCNGICWHSMAETQMTLILAHKLAYGQRDGRGSFRQRTARLCSYLPCSMPYIMQGAGTSRDVC